MSTTKSKGKPLTKREQFLREEYDKFRREQQEAWIARYEANLGNEDGCFPFKMRDTVASLTIAEPKKQREQSTTPEPERQREELTTPEPIIRIIG